MFFLLAMLWLRAMRPVVRLNTRVAVWALTQKYNKELETERIRVS